MELAENLVVANRFRLLSLVGKGGMGSVWRAFDQNLGTDCAIKFIEGDLAKRPDAQTRFKREAQAAAQLRSPNIVQIFDHNVWEGVPYCAMEFLEGEDLGKRLKALGKIPHADLAHVMSEACRGLQKAHEKGIIHRDLKPDNIFIVRDDDREIVKVLDFGIAKLTDGGMDVSSGTKTGTILGTPQYMSPEQAQGTKAIDARSDLWSLAIIAYECVTGELPLDSKALGDLLVKIIINPMPVPSHVDSTVPPAFDAWFAKATCRDPDGRFQSARAFADSLSVSLGVAAPIAPRMASMSGAGAGDSGAYQLGIGPSSGVSGVSGGMSAPMPGAGAVSSEPVLRPLSVTFAGGETAAGVPANVSTGRMVAIAAGVMLLVAAGIVGVVALRPKTAAGVQSPTTDIARPDPVPPLPALPATVTAAGLDPAATSASGGTASAAPSAVASVADASRVTGKPATQARTPAGGGAGGGGTSGGGMARPAGRPVAKPGTKPDLGF